MLWKPIQNRLGTGHQLNRVARERDVNIYCESNERLWLFEQTIQRIV